MTADTKSRLKMPVILAFVGTYVVLSALIIATNVIVFGLYDAKFGGPDIWPMYWAIWGTAYTPPVLVAVGTALALPMRLGTPQPFLWATLALILVAMQVSFLLDLKWRPLLAEVVVLCIVIPAVAWCSIRVDR